MRKVIYIAALLCLVACGEANQTTESKNEMQKGVHDSFAQNIETLLVSKKPLLKELILTGKVVCDPEKTISYSPLVGGVIVKNYFSLGDRVSKGQKMLDIRSSELSALQSELVIAKRTMQSAKSKFEGGLANELELVEARSNYEKLEADLSLYGESQGGGVFTIKSPGGGYVITKNGNAGAPISESGDPLFSIADLSTVWIEANLYAGNLQFVEKNQKVEISSVAYPNEVFSGEISFISQVFDPEDKALKVRIMLPNTALKLKPEMSVMVKVFNNSPMELIAIPNSVVIFDNDNYFVVVKQDNDFTVREVEIFNNHSDITYLSKGLNEGDEIVSKNQLLIYNELKGK